LSSGVYTEEHAEFVRELLARGIGPGSRKGWDEFAKHFNWRPSAYAYEHFAERVKNGEKFDGPKAIPVLEPTEPTDDDVKRVSREEQDRLKREWDRKMLHRLTRERAATDMIIDAIKEAAPSIPPINIPILEVPGGPHREQTAVLLFSDLHIGAVADIEETGGLGEYNYPIFRQRLQSLRDGIRSIANHHRMSHPVRNLVVLSLGDLIENVTIFASQRDAVDKDLPTQVLLALGDLSEFFLGLLDTFEHISVVAVSGNHGRIGRKGEFKHHVNWDYIINQVLKDKFKYTGTDRISFEVPKSPFAVVDVEGFTFLLRHGDGIKSWGGIPYYGVQRSTGRWIAMQASQGKRFDYMAMGHFHDAANLPFTGGETLMNGSFVGTSQFSVEVMESLARPVQIFGMVHPRHGLAGRYPIHLDGGREV
jgi:hypothetical protein